jgi:hypothetical protein
MRCPGDAWHQKRVLLLTSGINPPCSTPSKQRQTRNEVRPDKKNWALATMLQRVICDGIQRSGPTHLDTNWDGSSAQRKESRKMVLPRL